MKFTKSCCNYFVGDIDTRTRVVDHRDSRRCAVVKGQENMSKAFIAETIQASTNCTGVMAAAAAGDLVLAIVTQMKKEGGFTLPSFGTFTVRKTKARKALNPRTGEPVKVKAGKTVRFKASPNLKKAV
jgi:DNA-binding protein HU-beta